MLVPYTDFINEIFSYYCIHQIARVRNCGLKFNLMDFESAKEIARHGRKIKSVYMESSEYVVHGWNSPIVEPAAEPVKPSLDKHIEREE